MAILEISMKRRDNVITIGMTRSEYEALSIKAKMAKMTISRYMKSAVLPLNITPIERLLEEINKLQVGTSFSLKELFTKEWNYISKSDRLSLGCCMRNIGKDTSSGIIRDGWGKSGIPIYKKVGSQRLEG
jgi:hypothetical protein